MVTLRLFMLSTKNGHAEKLLRLNLQVPTPTPTNTPTPTETPTITDPTVRQLPRLAFVNSHAIVPNS